MSFYIDINIYKLKKKYFESIARLEDILLITLKGLCLIRVMSNFDLLDPGRYSTLK